MSNPCIWTPPASVFFLDGEDGLIAVVSSASKDGDAVISGP